MDDDDKIRRNLVVVSSVVLLLAWLQLPARSVVNKLLGEALAEQLPMARVWGAVALTIAYLGLRFRFALESREAYNEEVVEWRLMRDKKVRFIIGRHLARFTRLGTESNIFHGQLSSISSHATSATENETGIRTLGRPAFKIEMLDYDASGWPKAIGLTLFWEFEGRRIESEPQPWGSAFSRWQRFQVLSMTMMHTIAYSRASTYFLVPAVFGSAALLVSCLQLIRAL